jgi:hypothetical protein
MPPDFFNNHGPLTLVCLALFPRLTLLFGAFASGGLLWWLGWIFAPHLLVAILSLPYWHSNPALVIIAWLVALGGTSTEAKVAKSAKSDRKR